MGRRGAPDEHPSVSFDPRVGPQLPFVLCNTNMELSRFVAPAAEEVLQDESLCEAGPFGKETEPNGVGRPCGPLPARRCGAVLLGKPLRYAPEASSHLIQ